MPGTIADSMCLSPSRPWNGESGWNEISLIAGLNFRSRRAVPTNVPLVPRPATKCVSRPLVCSMISGAVVSFLLVYLVVQTTGLIGQADEFFKSFSDGSLSLSQFVGLPQVMAFAAVVAILNLIVVTVLGAVIAGIYNLAVKVTGGLLVGFTSN